MSGPVIALSRMYVATNLASGFITKGRTSVHVQIRYCIISVRSCLRCVGAICVLPVKGKYYYSVEAVSHWWCLKLSWAVCDNHWCSVIDYLGSVLYQAFFGYHSALVNLFIVVLCFCNHWQLTCYGDPKRGFQGQETNRGDLALPASVKQL